MDLKFQELNGVIAASQRCAAKLQAGTKCEGTRCRSNLSQASKIITDLRKMCLESSKAIPVKTRVVKSAESVEEPMPPQPVLVRQHAITTDETVKKSPRKRVLKKPAVNST